MVCLVCGFYTNVVNAFTDWTSELFHGDFANTGYWGGMLVALIVGILLGFYVVSKVMSFLLRRYRDYTYYLIIGFVAGSIISLFYNNNIVNYYDMWSIGECGSLSMTNEIIVGIVLLVVCIGLGLLFSEANHWRKRKNQAQLEESKNNTSIESIEEGTTTREEDPTSGNDPPGEGT